MFFLLSPAKSLNEMDQVPSWVDQAVSGRYGEPVFLDQACELMALLRQKDPFDLQELMGISFKLAEVNAARNQAWHVPFTLDNAKPAVYLFDGDVYAGLAAYEMTADEILYLNRHLGILSGLYGLLRPLDLIAPYRLEMGISLKNAQGENLYAFWQDKIARQVRQWAMQIESKEAAVVVNLASNEYFKAVDKKALDLPIITPRFEDRDKKSGRFKVVSFYAKKARGLMVKFAAQNALTKVADLKAFDLDGYRFEPDLSDDRQWVFRRSL